MESKRGVDEKVYVFAADKRWHIAFDEIEYWRGHKVNVSTRTQTTFPLKQALAIRDRMREKPTTGYGDPKWKVVEVNTGAALPPPAESCWSRLGRWLKDEQPTKMEVIYKDDVEVFPFLAQRE